MEIPPNLKKFNKWLLDPFRFVLCSRRLSVLCNNTKKTHKGHVNAEGERERTGEEETPMDKR